MAAHVILDLGVILDLENSFSCVASVALLPAATSSRVHGATAGPANPFTQPGAAPRAVTYCHANNDGSVPKIHPKSYRGCLVPPRLELAVCRRDDVPPLPVLQQTASSKRR